MIIWYDKRSKKATQTMRKAWRVFVALWGPTADTDVVSMPNASLCNCARPVLNGCQRKTQCIYLSLKTACRLWGNMITENILGMGRTQQNLLLNGIRTLHASTWNRKIQIFIDSKPQLHILEMAVSDQVPQQLKHSYRACVQPALEIDTTVQKFSYLVNASK